MDIRDRMVGKESMDTPVSTDIREEAENQVSKDPTGPMDSMVNRVYRVPRVKMARSSDLPRDSRAYREIVDEMASPVQPADPVPMVLRAFRD
jgi:hypothetical protein